ncbi:MAG: prepilin peptidase [Candidatus Aenigmatarchaeota archaeon]
MMEWILLAIGIGGFGLAGYLDLKTTEFPDWIPYAMIIAALGVRGAFALAAWDPWTFLSSVMVGCGFLVFGLALYFLKQWGDGDAWLLGALGFLFPTQAGLPAAVPTVIPFPLVLLFNFFIISFFYLIVYSVGLGVKHPKALRKFSRELKGDLKGIAAIVVAFALACLGVVMYMSWGLGVPLERFYHILAFPALLLGVVLFVQYGKFIEKNMFKKQIPASRLRAGDVPIDSKWRTLTEKELKAIKKRGGKVWVKEGVRMAPVFLITLLVTAFWGFLFTLFMSV